VVKVEGRELREGLYYWPHGLTWAKKEPDGRVRIGLSDLAQELAGKIRFCRTRPPGREVEQGKGVATLETGKWVGPVEAPITGLIDQVNDALRTKATLINEDPYGEGWVAVLKPSKPGELGGLVHGDALVEWYKKEIAERTKKK